MGKGEKTMSNRIVLNETSYHGAGAVSYTHLDVYKRQTIQEAHVTFKDLTPEKMGQELALPFHPGAERYFKEIGVIK